MFVGRKIAFLEFRGDETFGAGGKSSDHSPPPPPPPILIEPNLNEQSPTFHAYSSWVVGFTYSIIAIKILQSLSTASFTEVMAVHLVR